MPSFFEALKRMALGKPLFENKPQPGAPPPPPAPNPTAPNQPAATRTVPQVVLEQASYNLSGSKIEFHADIHNLSNESVELDKVRLLGVTRELDYQLGPGGKREFLLFLGNPPKDSYNHDCELYYKDQTGQYFLASHDVEFEKQPDGTYVIKRFRLEPPVRRVN